MQHDLVLGAALRGYKKKTGNDLLAHQLAAEFQSCDSVDAILDIIQDQAKKFDEFRDSNEKIMKWVGSLVQILYKFSALGGRDAKVRIWDNKCNGMKCILTLLCSSLRKPSSSELVSSSLFVQLCSFM